MVGEWWGLGFGNVLALWRERSRASCLGRKFGLGYAEWAGPYASVAFFSLRLQLRWACPEWAPDVVLKWLWRVAGD